MATTTTCPFEVTFEIIRGKWTSCLLAQLAAGPRGFNELLRLSAGLSAKVLTERLKDWERRDVIVRQVLPTSPPSSRYSLTTTGTDLLPLLEAIAIWGRRVADPAPAVA